MTDYLEEYREALRDGDEEKANEYYEKYQGSANEEDASADQADEETQEEEIMEDPSGMTVEEAKEYADGLEKEADVERFLTLEREGKDRQTLVDYLE